MFTFTYVAIHVHVSKIYSNLQISNKGHCEIIILKHDKNYIWMQTGPGPEHHWQNKELLVSYYHKCIAKSGNK